MKRTICTCLFLLTMLFTKAQSEKYDLSSFVIPKDWKKEIKPGMVTYTKLNGKSYCMIAVYPARTAGKDVDAEFKTEWETLVVKALGVTAAPAMSKEIKKGWNVISGSATATTADAGVFAVMLYTHIGYDKLEDAIIVFNADDFRNELGGFLTSFAVQSSGKVTTASTPVLATQSKPGTGSPLLKGNNLAGVWMGFQTGGFGFGKVSHDYVNNKDNYGTRYEMDKVVTKTCVFLSNGTYYDKLPYEGMHQFNMNDPKHDEGGTYSLSNGMVTAKLTHYPSTDRLWSFKPPGDLKYGGKFQYVRCKSVDGFRLAGTFIPADPTSVMYYNSLKVQVPSITFALDGTFRDDNLVGDYGRDPEDAPGAGTYEMLDFSLILHYSDGRIIKRSFNAFLDVEPAKAQKYYIGGTDVKRKPL